MEYFEDNHKLMWGALAGGALLSIASLLLHKEHSKPTNKDIKAIILDFLHTLSDKAQTTSEQLTEHTHEYAEKINNLAAQLSERVKLLTSDEHTEKALLLLLAGFAGAFLGTKIASLTLPSQKEGLKSNTFVDVTHQILEQLQGVPPEGNIAKTAPLQDSIQFILSGLQLYDKWTHSKK